jgi:hypothetical protein
MTDDEVLAAIRLVGKDRATERLAGLRRSDLEAVAWSKGVRVDVSRAEPAADLARRVVSVVTSRAERGAARATRTKGRSSR